MAPCPVPPQPLATLMFFQGCAPPRWSQGRREWEHHPFNKDQELVWPRQLQRLAPFVPASNPRAYCWPLKKPWWARKETAGELWVCYKALIGRTDCPPRGRWWMLEWLSLWPQTCGAVLNKKASQCVLVLYWPRVEALNMVCNCTKWCWLRFHLLCMNKFLIRMRSSPGFWNFKLWKHPNGKCCSYWTGVVRHCRVCKFSFFIYKLRSQVCLYLH